MISSLGPVQILFAVLEIHLENLFGFLLIRIMVVNAYSTDTIRSENRKASL